jgi:LysR family pca operon transcriptional activator
MLDARLKLRHLQALVALRASGSVLASANALARTPSAVSKSLAELEAIVGTRLFERTRRGLLPTEAAQRLLDQVQRGLGLLGDAMDQIAGRSLPAGPPAVTLGVLPTAAATLTPGAVQAFQRLYPDAVVRVVEGTNLALLERLRQRGLDVVIGRLADAALMFDLSFEPLYEEPLMLVAASGHPLAGQAGLTLKQVCAHPVILPDADTIVRATLDPCLIAGGVPRPPRSIETLSAAFARQLVAQGDAVWFCAPGVVMPDLAEGRFVGLDVDLGATRRAVGLSVRSDAPLSPAAAELADLLRTQARRLRAGVGAAPRQR